MEIADIYAIRDLPRPSLSQEILDIISQLKISFKPAFRRAPRRRDENWRDAVLLDTVRKVRERDDPDYDVIVGSLNKLTTQTYTKLMTDILERVGKRDQLFRLRVTTLLFDRGVRQNFFAPLMADAYADIIKKSPDASNDLLTQVAKFDELYDVNKIIVLPSADDPNFEQIAMEWGKLKETKRGFAVYIAELYSRGLIPDDIMNGFVTQVFADLREAVAAPKTSVKEEHVDALVKFVFAISSKIPSTKAAIRELLAVPRAEVPCLNMKSKFKLEDALK
jgi:hypothetical protein